MKWRIVTADDAPLLARLNRQLIEDEGHRNAMTVDELEQRMRGWLTTGEYRAIVFEDSDPLLAYALYRETDDEVYLRQLFVVRERRHEGVGRKAMQTLFSFWPPHKRLTVSVLAANKAAVAFWRAVGYTDYDLTLEIMPRV